ncbi:MAG: hypothetical protein IJW48_02230 [Clostridia bacterium]|nr:hypothetical protein [Clostridia bacterium]
MNVNSKRIRIYTALMLLFAASAVSLRTVACLRDLIYEHGYYDSKVLITASAYVVFGGCILLFSYIFLAERMSPQTNFSSPKTYAPTGVAGIGLLFIAIYLFKSGSNGENNTVRYVTSITALFALISIVHFFLNAFISESRTELRGYFSLATVVFLALYAAYLYFNSKLPLNAPNKLIDQLAFLSSALFFLYESRISLGREKWRCYVTFGLIASFLTAYSSIPALITYFVKGRIISNSIEESVLTATLFFFITSRLFLTASISERGKSSAALAMHAYAERREAAVLESMQVHKEAFSKQMTIDDLLPTVPEDSKDDLSNETADETET